MILHRLRLNNFRGVTDREIRFPDRGVVVVCGPNEIGKSSMLEALDLLLTYRDRSSHRDVKQVKPANADVGAQVEAEISTGPYRFVYRKQFHKKTGTELDIIEPRREHHTGDEAHERVAAMLAETVDTRLWEAQRVLQAASTAAVNLSGSDALARALDAAAGEVAAGPSGADALLVDRIDIECERYLTRTGKPTKEWKAAIERVSAAEQEVFRCRAAVAEVHERVIRHEQLTEAQRARDAALLPAAQRLDRAQQAQTVVTELAQLLADARLEAKAAAAAHATTRMADSQRRQLIADVDRRGQTCAELREQLEAARQREEQVRAVVEEVAGEAQRAASVLADAQQRLDSARAAAESWVAREEADRLAARLTRIEEAERKLEQLTAQLAAITLTEAAAAGIERHAGLVERLEAQRDADVAVVEFTAPADLDITVDGQVRTLAAGESWSQPASVALSVDVPGVVNVRVDPGASAVRLQSDLHAAQRLLDDALSAAGVADIAAARALDQTRRELHASRERAIATLDLVRDGDDVQVLRGRLAQLRAAVTGDPATDPETAAAELADADEALKAARADAGDRQAAVTTAEAALTAAATEATLVRDRLSTADAELAAVREQLSAVRADVADEVLAAAADTGDEALRAADANVAALAERYAAADPAAVEAELAAASEAAAGIAAERESTALALHALTAELSVIGTEGRQGQLDAAEAELERARNEYTRVEARATAAQLLRDTMIRHRDNTRQRYVAPYRAELERLGREVFNSSFEVDVNTELTIQTRTLDGCTVPFDSLSGGAKEQLGILARLAGAALVAEKDTVPVVIDDALGFTDPERLDRMGAVLNSVGDRGQVIVLTCTPGRYDSVTDAEVIELSA